MLRSQYTKLMHIAIIGGGAAGFFAAIRVKETHPESHVVIFEKKNRLLLPA